MRHFLLLLLLILPMAGCVHTRQNLPQPILPPGAPEVAPILASLNGPDRILNNLESNGTIRMQLPGEAGTQRFDTGRIQFQAPDRFLAQGRKLNVVVRIYSTGEAFLLELPSDNTFYDGREGDHFEDIALDIAPSRIFRELFLIGLLDGVDPGRVAVTAYDEQEKRAVLEVRSEGRKRKLARRLVVENVPEGWVVVESQVFDADGDLIGKTECQDYVRLAGVLLPAKVTASFPKHEAEMSFFMRTNTAKVNQEQPLAMDDIDAKRAELLEKGFREVRGETKKDGAQ